MYDLEEAELKFREQDDGRRVSFLSSGKVVLVDLNEKERVHDGDTWVVRLEHREMFAVAYPIKKVADASESEKPEPAKEQIPDEDKPVSRPFEAPANRPLPSQILQPQDRVAIFVDGANVDGACRDAGYRIDYYELGNFLRGGATFRGAYYFVADFTDQNPSQEQFLDNLAHFGYIVRKKRVKKIWDDEVEDYKFKANVDTELVLDMVNTAPNYDVAFLLSGDSDYERAVDLLRAQGKRVYVMTSEKTLSRELNHIADKPVFYLEDYQDLLERKAKA